MNPRFDFRAAIGDEGYTPPHAGRRRPRYHLVAVNQHSNRKYQRRPGQALCNPNLLFALKNLPPAPEEEPSCSACIARAEKHGIEIVTPGGDTPTT